MGRVLVGAVLITDQPLVKASTTASSVPCRGRHSHHYTLPFHADPEDFVPDPSLNL